MLMKLFLSGIVLSLAQLCFASQTETITMDPYAEPTNKVMSTVSTTVESNIVQETSTGAPPPPSPGSSVQTENGDEGEGNKKSLKPKSCCIIF